MARQIGGPRFFEGGIVRPLNNSRFVGFSRKIGEEITSEVFLALHQNSERIDTGQLPAWLLIVAKHRVADYWRRWNLEDLWALTPPPEQT